MNIKSLKFRIVILFSSILIVAISIIFTSFYIVTNKIIYQQVDKELLLHSYNLNQFNSVPGMVITLLNQNGSIVDSSLSFDTPYVSYKYLFEVAQKNRSITYTNQNIGNTPMRFLVKPVYENDKLTEVLLIAHPIEAIQKSLNLLLSILAIIFAIFIAPVILGAIMFTNKIIKPLSNIIQNMDDITSENLDKRLEDPGSNDEIQRLTLTFNNLLDRLQQSFKRERQFIEDIAHELKTPIATLKGGIELTLSKDRSKLEYEKTLEETLIDTDKISNLVKNLLDLAWVGASHNETINKQFNLSKLLYDLSQITTKLGQQKKINVSFDLEPKIKIFGDEGKINRALVNIIENAIKYTPNGKKISVSLKLVNKNAIMEIKDEGVGIAKEDLSHVFERFYRGSKSTKTLGSGLGLAIAQGIINAHGGSVKILSKIGTGTLVKVYLPTIWTK
ncbi:hypothetical protein A2130_04595 [Candidatus Woesebacteria bacterium GWC2_33_12]|nr:MAG: hypothetical protein A2130_04595 [Candidatus Woesebacteria bacterium GWC2_33_12]OGM80518.1 MAG: hypothetical protein A2366_01850 [Candidatus Woesebacteria bacterium RIFOXYB1_FULL_33_9]OGM87433.1 MAG: hypothetical protein A2616_00635 [Candidatus Woesebacteria bacterium RIFOXYD1_FULL_33_11]